MSFLVGWGRRIRRWPKHLAEPWPWGGHPMSTAIKVVSTEGLQSLMALAERTPGASANGRPEWLEKHRSKLGVHYVVVFGPQDVHYRCVVISELGGEVAGYYSLDIARRSFHALPDISPADLVTLAHRYLSGTDHIPLDPQQQKTWDDLSQKTGDDAVTTPDE